MEINKIIKTIRLLFTYKKSKIDIYKIQTKVGVIVQKKCFVRYVKTETKSKYKFCLKKVNFY